MTCLTAVASCLRPYNASWQIAPHSPCGFAIDQMTVPLTVTTSAGALPVSPRYCMNPKRQTYQSPGSGDVCVCGNAIRYGGRRGTRRCATTCGVTVDRVPRTSDRAGRRHYRAGNRRGTDTLKTCACPEKRATRKSRLRLIPLTQHCHAIRNVLRLQSSDSCPASGAFLLALTQNSIVVISYSCSPIQSQLNYDKILFSHTQSLSYPSDEELRRRPPRPSVSS
jgi:hypothetical protein